MPRFRPANPQAMPGDSVDLLAVGQLIDAAMQPGNFFVAPDLHLSWIFARAETIPWEIFRGRLVEPTRLQKTFLSWHVLQEKEPVLSVKLDVHERRIHVTRGFLAYVWEGYDAGGGVIESRETQKWTRELVGTIVLSDFTDLESVHDELICLLWQAVVGTSRLPLTSVEAPLPAFSFGQLHYLYRGDAGEIQYHDWQEFLKFAFRPEVAGCETFKLLEFALRAAKPEERPRFVELILRIKPHGCAIGEIGQYWSWIFNGVSLSPYTGFVDNAFAVIDLLARREVIGAGERINFLGRLARKLGRHLTAYDLVTFHHRGANYPDALLLDVVLKRFLHAIQAQPERFLGNDPCARRHRRALRQACLLRRHYEGLLVPDLPTSPGENARVLPPSHPRLPEEQMTQILRRRRRLCADDPMPDLLNDCARAALAQSVSDLEHLDERVEMGLGVFIDRPIGYAKAIGEPDLTPMLAHEAFSPSIARRRWNELKKLCAELACPIEVSWLDALFEIGPWPAGLPHAQVADCPRPVPALADVRKVADDFVVLRTLPGGLSNLLGHCDWRPVLEGFSLRFLAVGGVRLCVQAFNEAREPVLALYDEQLRRRVELSVDAREGYFSRGGSEWPRAGLRVRAVWEDGAGPPSCTRVDLLVRPG